MNLIIDKYIINTDAKIILEKLRQEVSKPLFKSIRKSGDNVVANCPVHKGGQENKPSFNVYNRTDNDKIEFGTCHCFTCGYSVSLPTMIGDCFDADINFGKKWLVEHFGNTLIEEQEFLEEIKLSPSKINIKPALNESVLEQYDYYHPYMWKRKLSKEIVDRFRVGYDKNSNSLTFPVWDDKGNLRLITRRSVEGKKFNIEEGVDKPVYLLNYIKSRNITEVMVTESQINCLYLWSLGYPSIALLGTGSESQLNILKRSGIRHFILCFDGDYPGDKGAYRFIKSMPKDILISIKKLPRGKDCNDLTKEEFDNLEIIDI